MIKAVIFDCFGVLYVDALRAFIETYADSVPGDPWEFYHDLATANDLGQLSDAEYYGRLSEVSGRDAGELKAEMHNTASLNLKLIEFIQELKQTYKIGLLTNANSRFIAPFLDNHNIRELFDDVVISSEVGMVKPQAELFELAATRLDLLPGEVVFVDDVERNVTAATETGMHGVVFDNLASLREKLMLIAQTS